MEFRMDSVSLEHSTGNKSESGERQWLSYFFIRTTSADSQSWGETESTGSAGIFLTLAKSRGESDGSGWR